MQPKQLFTTYIYFNKPLELIMSYMIKCSAAISII